MASGFPLIVNGNRIRSSEALYQACRYPHLPDVQALIFEQSNGMSAKMKSKAHYAETRADWENVRIAVMRWSIEVKLAHHFHSFGLLLESTAGKPIVEDSAKDPFWGAIDQGGGTLRGVNALGRLLMQLRDTYNSPQRYELLCVESPEVSNFRLLGEDVQVVDERLTFLYRLMQGWSDPAEGTTKAAILRKVAEALRSQQDSALEGNTIHDAARNSSERALLELFES